MLSSIAALADDRNRHALLHRSDDHQMGPGREPAAGRAMAAVLEGDPGCEAPFTMRIRMPNGHQAPPHSHSRQERVTADLRQPQPRHRGCVQRQRHQAAAGRHLQLDAARDDALRLMSGDTVLQLTTMGPWTITYVNPNDDPRSTEQMIAL